MKELELRLYFFVPYQLTGIQQGIQSGHAALELALKYGRNNPNHIIWDFIEKHKTWVILNGGTTNSTYDNDGTPKGSLNQISDSLYQNNIEFERFFEPDLNDAMTAVCFICDERVFDRENYPMFKEYLLNNYVDGFSYNMKQEFHSIKYDSLKLKEKFPVHYREWVDLVGGEKNAFLKELIDGKKLA